LRSRRAARRHRRARVSRLDSLIRRLQAQRACLVHAARLIGGVPGPIFEIGLGNGRTYDHLRALCPAREIFVFERRAPDEPGLGPGGRHLVLGDIRETVPAAASAAAARPALVHSDIGSGDSAGNARLAAALAGFLPGLLAPGGIALSDLALPGAGDWALPPPAGVAAGRYFLYRRP